MEAIRKHMVEWKPSKEQRKAFKPLMKAELERNEKYDEDSKMGQFFTMWLNNTPEMQAMQRKINKAVYKDGGAFDKFAGDDHLLSFDELVTMHDKMTAQGEKMTGEKAQPMSKDFLKKAYEAYDNLDPNNKGISKWD